MRKIHEVPQLTCEPTLSSAGKGAGTAGLFTSCPAATFAFSDWEGRWGNGLGNFGCESASSLTSMKACRSGGQLQGTGANVSKSKTIVAIRCAMYRTLNWRAVRANNAVAVTFIRVGILVFPMPLR